MNAPFRQSWTQEQFIAWAGAQEGRYEFDGFEPVAMTGGTANHSLITQNVQAALRGRLRGSGCRALGPDAGLVTVGEAVRYPDALVTCSKFSGGALAIPGVVVVFEVVSASSGRTDRIVKVREYAAVSSIRRYVILESGSAGATVFERASAEMAWTASTLTGEDLLRMPEIDVAVPIGEFYEDVDFGGAAEVAGTG
jgi:Uma2 family endonuclease